MSNKTIFPLLFSLILISCSQKPIALPALLEEMVSYEAPATFPSRLYKTLQVSSYDRRTVSEDQPGWFANDDGFGFVRADTMNGRIEKVLFDEKGPGVITRIWMTTSDKRGSLRFYFDDADTADITIPAYDMDSFPLQIGKPLSLTHTHYVEDLGGVGGNTFFLPLPFSKSCKITLEEPAPDSRIPRYYQIVFRKYDPKVKVETFSLEKSKEVLPLIAEVSEKLTNPSNFNGGETYSENIFLPSVGSVSLSLPEGQNAIRNMSLKFSGLDSASTSDLLRNCFISIFFDGVKCVDCPVDCFFGCGTGAPKTKNWYMESDGNESFVSRWLMPYSDSARIYISNNSEMAVKAELSCAVDEYRAKTDKLYFHATYRQEDSVRVSNDYDSNENIEWNFITIHGKGIYCGDVLSLYNHCPAWYGEGDEKIWLDDDAFPSTIGTGTEDYYNCSWAPVKPFDTPFGGALRADEESSHGYNTFMRTRNCDLIPFARKFKFDLEMLGWIPGIIDIRTVSFWYGDLASRAE